MLFHRVADSLPKLDDHRGSKGQECHQPQLGGGGQSHLEEAVQARHKEHGRQERHPRGESAEAGLVAGEAQGENGLLTPAVEAVEAIVMARPAPPAFRPMKNAPMVAAAMSAP